MRKHRIIVLLILLALAIVSTLALRGQVKDVNLQPPTGAKLAIVVFEDLQCSDCANAAPLLHAAERDYKIPLVVRDFPLPRHKWAFAAAVLARYFASQSNELGTQFRTAVYQHQEEINPDNLRAFAEKFAKEHNTALPAAVDPDGKFAAAIKADQEFGKSIGVTHTPTIYVVNEKRSAPPFIEVVNRADLYAMIDEMKKELD
jgi:protein-disulfide isomerase